MRSFTLAAAVAASASLGIHSAASAQISVDEAHQRVNRLLTGAGVVLVYKSGRKLDGIYGRLSDVRTADRCTTRYTDNWPNNEEIPASERGTAHPDTDMEWGEVSNPSASGARFYWVQIREATGRPFTYFYQFGSQGAAEEFLASAKVLMAACGGGEDKPDVPEQALEERVFDDRAGSASLAIDRRQGTRYGWAIDYASWAESDARALAECQRNGGNCQIVLRFTGGCGAYAADQAKGSSVYGWGTATSRQAAENRARGEAQERGGKNVITRVWGCNSDKTAGSAGKVTGGKATGASSTGAGLPGKGKLSEDVIRRNEAAAAAHKAQVQAYQDKLKANAQALEQSVAQRQANDAAHQAELAKAQAAQAEFERQRQAYREEYKRVTGKYPED